MFQESIPQVMGILNVTPDSFFDGGRYLELAAAVDRAARMVEEGAAILDVGGESTRPGARPISAEQEIERVAPVLEALRARFPVTLAVDTSKPEVMTAALAAGATFINDVRALRVPGALEVVAASSAQVCLMHLQGEPFSMQDAPHYEDVVAEVKAFLIERVRICEIAGISKKRIIIDPGFGFGKLLTHNQLLLSHLHHLTNLGLPILVGLSRKSMIGQILNVPVERRLHGSLALAVIAAGQGAAILRVHDIGPTIEALRVWHSVFTAKCNANRLKQ
ncbi:dihydropteroate synthase [Gammaproteobacteria bacterium]